MLSDACIPGPGISGQKTFLHFQVLLLNLRIEERHHLLFVLAGPKELAGDDQLLIVPLEDNAAF
jgi:hypothetical protein